MKNLILKKELPTVVLDGELFERPKGTVYSWNEKDKHWELCGPEGSTVYVEKEDVKANPDWYGKTTKKPTYPVFEIGGYSVIFKKGLVEVGCTSITNDEVREIIKHLRD